MENNTITNITEKPNSYEFGKAGSRHKIYYDKANDLHSHIEELKLLGLIEEVAPIVEYNGSD